MRMVVRGVERSICFRGLCNKYVEGANEEFLLDSDIVKHKLTCDVD